MVGAGSVMILLGLYGVYKIRKVRILENTLYLNIMVWAIFLLFIANSTVWIMTVMGRQLLLVFGLMNTEYTVSTSVTAGVMLFYIIVFNLLYEILVAISILLFVTHIKKTDYDEKEPLEDSGDPYDQKEAEGGANIGS